MQNKLGSLSADREMNVLREVYENGGTYSATWLGVGNYPSMIAEYIIDDLCQYRYLKWNEDNNTYSITAKGKAVIESEKSA